MEAIKIIDPGPLTTVQDKGRYGYQRYGVSASGMMDVFAGEVANMLVSNLLDRPVLETTLKGPTIEFIKDCMFAVTGGKSDIFLNENKVSLWENHMAHKGDILKIGFCKNGLRNYIAFHGGIEVTQVMKSCSTNLRAKIGGYNGRKLNAQDILKINDTQDHAKKKKLDPKYIPDYPKELEIQVIFGQQNDCFTSKGIETFLKNTYLVTQESDRMGMRLSGEAIEHKDSADIISDGITFGAIQVPGNGQPIIMMADRQTTGGYTKIGNVTSVDLNKLAQATPGTKIRFVSVPMEKGVEDLRKLRNIIQDKNSYIEIENESKKESEKQIKEVRKYKIKINGKEYDVEIAEA